MTWGNRPRTYRDATPEDFEQIFENIEQGISMKKICSRLDLHQSLTHNLIDGDPVLSVKYALARRRRVEHHQEEALEIGYAATRSTKWRGRDVDINGARLLVDVIKWSSGRMDPSGGPVQRLEHGFTTLSDDELDRKIKEKLAAISVSPCADEPEDA